MEEGADQGDDQGDHVAGGLPHQDPQHAQVKHEQPRVKYIPDAGHTYPRTWIVNKHTWRSNIAAKGRQMSKMMQNMSVVSEIPE